MSSIHYAYSEELNRVINPYQAYDSYWEGKLTDKRRFQCPGNNCNAQITCASMDIPETNLKQVPHFRVMEDHNPDCEYLKYIEEKSVSYLTKEGLYTKKGNIKETFVLTREINKQDKIIADAKFRGIKTKYIKCPDGYSKYTPNPKYYSITPIVDNYFKYREKKEIDDKYIIIGNATIAYEDLFKGIFYKLKYQNYFGIERIYWGKAFINRLKNGNGYRIKFVEYLETENAVQINPSVIIYDEIIENFRFKKRLKQYLNINNVNENKIFLFFIYGEIKENFISENRRYLNIDAKNLDYIDFKNTDYLGKLVE